MVKKNIFFKILLIALFLFGVSRLFVTKGGSLEYVLSSGLYPFLKAQKSVVDTINSWLSRRASYEQLLSQLEQQRLRLEELQKQLIEARAVAHYWEKTKDVREFLERYSIKEASTASVLFRHFDSAHFFIVDKGARAGIKKNMIALYKNCLVGRVTEVYPLYSKVQLVTDPLSRVAAFCATTGAKGIYEGTGKLKTAFLSYINPQDELQKGDMILSSGEGLIFPRGFAIATLDNDKQETTGSRRVVTLLLDYAMVDYCALIPHDIPLDTTLA